MTDHCPHCHTENEVDADGYIHCTECHRTTDTQQGRPWRSQPWSAFRSQTPDRHRWLVDGLLPTGTLAFVAGPPKKGKTWLGLALALAVATGQPLAGEYEVDEARDVLYVALEGSNIGLRARTGALARGVGVDPDSDQLERFHLLYRPRPFDLIELDTSNWLLEEAVDVDAALVVVDVLRAAARFKENDAADFAQVRGGLDPLLVAGRTVVLLHHFGKLTDTQKERSPGERMAGTGAMYGALDVGLLITRSESGARRMRVDVEARDFAAPDALGIVILGAGSGEHGGFTYTDTATLALDETAVEGRDLVAAVDALFADQKWRTLTELAAKEDGIGANRDDLEAVLKAAPDRFAQIVDDGRRAGRHASARPWGTLQMLDALEELEKVARAPEQPEQPSASEHGQQLVEQVAPPIGGSKEQPALPDSVRGCSTDRASRSTPIDGAVPLAGDDGFLDYLADEHAAGWITTEEALERGAVHDLIVRGQEAAS